MGDLLFQKTIQAESIMTSGLGATGAILDLSAEGRQVLTLPLDSSGEVAVVIRCGRILESLASAARLFLVLSMFTDATDEPYVFKAQCEAKQPGDEGDAPVWNASESTLSASFPSTVDELVHAEIEIATGDARDNLQQGFDLDILLRLLPDAERPAAFLSLRHAEVRQELP